MTKKPFRTLFKPISVNVHQQFFMEILSRHQWEAFYLWPFIDLVYLLEQEQETIDPETYVKELVVTNPIILSALRTTIRQETKRQFNKNISHTYTNKIFPLATKTELRQGGRKQSVQTLIKLIHSVEKYYDDHNGERKTTRTNSIKEDPKKWTWQLYQELNQALMHPSAVHQKLFYQNYSNLETRQSFKKNQQDFHVDHQDVIKKLEILLLPAIEKTRQNHEATQIKRSSKLKGNLRGNFQSVSPMEQVSLSQIKNLIQRTSVLKKESVERQRVLRSRFIHSRMIKTLLSDQKNQQQLKVIRSMDTTMWDETSHVRQLTNTLKKQNLIYREDLQKDSVQTQTVGVKKRHIGKVYEETVENSVLENRLKGIVKRISVPRKNLSTKLTRISIQEKVLNDSAQTPQNLIYRESLQKADIVTQKTGVATQKTAVLAQKAVVKNQNIGKVYEETVEYPVLENRIKEIIKRVSVEREHLSRSQTRVIGNQDQLNPEENVLTKSTESQLTNIFEKQLNEHNVKKTVNRLILQRRNAQNLIYRESLQKAVLETRQDTVKIREAAVKTNEDVVQVHAQSQLQSAEYPVLENRIKDIIKRVSVDRGHLSRNQTHVTRNQTQLNTQVNVLTKSIESQLTNVFEKQLIDNLGMKTATLHNLQRRSTQNLIYRESLQKAVLNTRKDAEQTNEDIVQAHAQSQPQTQTVEYPVLEKRIKDIIKRVSVEREYLSRNQTQLNTQENVLTKSIEKQLIDNLGVKTAILHNLQRSSTQNLIYRESLQKAVLQTLKDTVKTNEDIVQAHAQSQLQTLKYPVLENRIKDIIKRVSVDREHLNRNQTHLTRSKTHATKSQTQLNAQEKILVKSVESQLTNAFEKQLLNNLEFKTTKHLILKRNSIQNLIYRESLQKAVWQTKEEGLKTEEDGLKTKAAKIQAHDHYQSMKYPVLENRIKAIIKRVSVETQRINRFGAKVTNDFEVKSRNNFELKTANGFNLQRRSTQNLIYRENLQRNESQTLTDTQTYKDTQVYKETKKQTKQQVILDNKIKEIMKRVSLETQWTNRLEKKGTNRLEVKSTNRFTSKSTKSLREKYYQTIPEMIFQLTESQLEKSNALHISEKNQIEGSSLKTIKILNTVNTLKTLVQSKNFVQFNRAFGKTYSQTQTKNEVSALDEKSIEAIEALRTKLYEVKETEKAEQQHDRLLITSSRNLVLKNRKESELRHLKEDEGSKILQTKALKTVLNETQKTVLNKTQKTVLNEAQKLVLDKTAEVALKEKRDWQHKKLTSKTTLVKHQNFHPLVQAVSKTIDKTWIKEVIKETNLLRTEHQEMEGISSSSMGSDDNRTAAVYGNGIKNETLFQQQQRQQQQELQQQIAGRRDTFSSESHSEFEMDGLKLDLIADQVFRRVTDKFERERKRRGM